MILKTYAGVVVDDLEKAGEWYERVLGRVADAAPMGGLLEWHFDAHGGLQVVDLATVRTIQKLPYWGSAGSSSITLVVGSLDDQLAVLRENDIALVSSFDTASSLRTATVADPSGNLVTFVEDPTVRTQ